MTGRSKCPRCGTPFTAKGEPCLRCLLGAGLEAAESNPLGCGFLDDLPVTSKELLIADRYRVVETIGRGGLGVVYKAWQEDMGRLMAVKVISGGTDAGVERKARFVRDAKTLARLQHPGIVGVTDWGEDKGLPFFCMDYVDGRDLAQEVRVHGPLASRRAAAIVKTVGEVVAYAHGQHVLHGDLKPQNVMLTAEGRVKVTDFGLTKAMDLESLFSNNRQSHGMAGYVAPERALGTQIGPAADVYGLGCVLYHLLSGRAPFVGNSVEDVLEQVKRVKPLPVRWLEADVPEDLAMIFLKCMEKQPSMRYGSAQAVVEALGRFLSEQSLLARPPAG